MTNRKIISSTYWKQADNGLLAHVYEHLASEYLTTYLLRQGHYAIANYAHWAKTYGSIAHIDFVLYSNKTAKVLQKAYRTFSKSRLSFDQVQKAAQQVAVEYERPLTHLDSSFVDQINTLHKQPWKNSSELNVSVATTETSVNTVFETTGIRFGRRTPASFNEATLHFEVDKKLYADDPAMKALAILVTQAFALNLHTHLGESTILYDTGDSWDQGAPTVAYRTSLFFTKNNTPTQEQLAEMSLSYKKVLLTNGLSSNLTQTIVHAYKDERAHYFSLEAMNEITDGIIIGYKGWKEVGTAKNVHRLLDALEIKVL